MEEKAVWDGIRKGETDALKELYDGFFGSLYSYGMRMTGSASDTEDAIHELFLDIWKYRERLSDTTSIKFYLFRSLRRKIYKSSQLLEKEVTPDESHWNKLSNSEHSVEKKLISDENEMERSMLLQQHLDKLSERQRETLLLRFYGDLSFQEIAEMMDINEQSARNLVTRALDFLRKLMLCLLLISSSQWFFRAMEKENVKNAPSCELNNEESSL